MKLIDFTKLGGYRFEQPTLEKMQESYYFILESFIKYLQVPEVGSFIISGCEIIGPNITSGICYIDGELCGFTETAGTLGSKIKKIESFEDLSFFNGTNPPVFRSVSAVVDPTGILLSDFVRVKSIPELPTNLVLDPADLTTTPPEPTVLERIIEIEKKVNVFQSGGGMVLWNKPASTIPAGWQEVVNWRGRMPVGMDITVDGSGNFANPEFSPVTTGGSDPGRSGGAKSHTMTLANLIEHDHGLTQILNNSNGSGNNGFFDQAQGGATNLKTDKKGSATPTPIPTLSPFRTVIFIEYIG